MSWLLRRRDQGRRERGRPAHPDVLTPAEWRVLECVRGGLPNAEIAVRLGVSVNTVRYHVSNMLAKLELDNRHDLAAWDGTPAVAVEEPASGRRFRLGFPLFGWITGNAGGAVAASVAVVAVAVAAAVVILLVAGNDEAGLRGPDDDGVFVTMLSVVPRTPAARGGVALGDVARSREVLGIERPVVGVGEALEQETIVEYWQAFAPSESGMPVVHPHFLSGEGVRQAVEFGPRIHDALGLSLFDVDQWVMTGQPPRMLNAFRGSVDPAAVDARIDACDQCPPADIEDRRSWRIYGWGEGPDLARAEQPPLFDQLRRGGNLAVTARFAMHAFFEDDIRAMVDAADGHGSLADDEDFLLAARGMDRLGALGALISERTQGPDAAGELPPALADAWALDEDDPLLVPYEVFAIGPGWDGDPYTAVVLVHASTEAAEENARRLPDRVAATRFAGGEPDGAETWGEVIEEIAIEVEGRVVLARLHGHAAAAPGPAFGFMLLSPLLRHE